tara:strand:- start:21464 stop:21901 length:438 start_codon:yes stop_codon:yes gene_type:complete
MDEPIWRADRALIEKHFIEKLPVLEGRQTPSGNPAFTVFELPSNDPDAVLSIEFDSEEITVFFDAFHTHFDASHYVAASDLVKSILEEKTAILIRAIDGQWAGSQTVQVDQPSEWVSIEPRTGESIWVRAWSGLIFGKVGFYETK